MLEFIDLSLDVYDDGHVVVDDEGQDA